MVARPRSLARVLWRDTQPAVRRLERERRQPTPSPDLSGLIDLLVHCPLCPRLPNYYSEMAIGGSNGLLPGWEQGELDGKTYYVNHLTKATQWEVGGATPQTLWSGGLCISLVC